MGTSATRTTGGRLPSSKAVLRGLPALLALTLLMALPSLAWAGNPSLDQYVESVPTGHGNGPSHHGGSSSATQLPEATRRQIEQQGGSDAPALEAVAGNPALGAPDSAGKAGHGAGSGKRTRNAKPGGSAPTAAGTASPSALDAATTAATGGDDSSGAILLVALALLTLVAAAVALARRRQQPA